MNQNELSENRCNYIQELALKTLKLSNNRNPFAIAETLDVRVIFCVLAEKLPGFTSEDTIYINDKLDLYSKKIVCAHELGHYMLHSEKSDFELFDADSNIFIEFEANLFAKVLMPQAFSRVTMNDFKLITDFNNYVKKQIKYQNER